MLKPNTLREHALVVSFFPTVTMGPILRFKNVLTQFQETVNKGIKPEQLAPGIALLSIGLFKKVVIADSFAIIADTGFASASTLSMVMAWVISLSYTMQVYFDFSGYSDAAIGIAMMIGIYIPANFNSPYQALSIIEFWQRWHISLTTFITTYVYTPIVRSFKKITFKKAMLATLISMIIVGVWHGSTINFFIFGFLHGVALVINNYWQKKIKIKLPNFLAWFLTFIFLNCTFVIFRADSFIDAIQILTSMFSLNLLTYPELVQLGANKLAIPPMIVGVSLLIFAKRNSNQIIKEFNPTLINLIGFLILTIISMIYLNSNFSQEYIYNDF
jgi:D-alanyl-lipoteichoic acid acyltransferase DltB (MBOAT superfamily)